MTQPIALQYSPLDSARFGRRIFRTHLSSVDAVALNDALRAERVETLIVRIPAYVVDGAARLRAAGMHPIFADTHLDYDIALPTATPVLADAGVALTDAQPEVAERVRSMARHIFDDYPSHYAANPLFPPSSIADGYADWAARLVGSSDGVNWFVERGSERVGFACCSVDHATGVARGLLNGILPASQGSGSYRAMFQTMLTHFRDAGLQTFAIATQANNIAVQRVWADAGLRLRRAENTFHINRDF